MSRRRARRFRPSGRGWIRVVDDGDMAAWLRPSLDGSGVEGVVWMRNWAKEGSARPWEVWEIYEPSPAQYLDEVFNKMRRVRLVADPDRLNPTWHDGEPKDPADLAHEHAIRWTMREVGPSCPRTHRRRNWNRHVWLGRTSSATAETVWSWAHKTRLPRKLRKALCG